MKIISWNTNGLRATAKQGNLIPLFAYNNADIVCLQETKCEPDQLDDATRNPSFATSSVHNYGGSKKATAGKERYHSYFSYSKLRKGYSGVAIYSKIEPLKVEYGMGIKRFDDEGRTVIAYYKDFVLINCYFPNAGIDPARLKYKLEFYDAFLKFINKLVASSATRRGGGKTQESHNVIFCGDINTAHNAIDLARPKANENNTGFLRIERDWLDKVVENDFVDIFRTLHPEMKDVYTYWDMKTFARSRNVGWRIDYFFTNKSFLKNVKSFKTLSDYPGSDHCPILLDISI